MHEMMGVINIFKEKGFTSHDVVAVVRKTLGRIKTGHTGTLDPQAEGVLPICIGRATKLANLLTAQDKQYKTEVILGITTDTGDQTGQILSSNPVCFDPDTIQKVVASFAEGEYWQTPPMYSAIKINGQKLYTLAREGISVQREARLVRMDHLAITAFHPDTQRFDLTVSCGKGTYIRSLCVDIGEKLNCGACMGALTRIRSGRFTVEDSVTLDTFKEAVADGRLGDYLMPVDQVLSYPSVAILPEGVKLAVNGNPIPLPYAPASNALPQGALCFLYDTGQLLAIYQKRENELTPEVMLHV